MLPVSSSLLVNIIHLLYYRLFSDRVMQSAGCVCLCVCVARAILSNEMTFDVFRKMSHLDHLRTTFWVQPADKQTDIRHSRQKWNHRRMRSLSGRWMDSTVTTHHEKTPSILTQVSSTHDCFTLYFWRQYRCCTYYARLQQQQQQQQKHS